MSAPSWPRRLFAFLIGALIAVLWGSVVQTQFNLFELQQLGVRIDDAVRTRTTLQDLASFAPLYALIVLPALVVAFVVAGGLSPRFPLPRMPLFALAGWVGVIAAIRLVDALVPPPVLIAATRSWLGLLAVGFGGAAAGMDYVLLTRGRGRARSDG